MMIDYKEISEYLLNSMNCINAEQNEILYRMGNVPVELKEKAKHDQDSSYWSFDRAYSRAEEVVKLIEFKDEPDFEYFALSNLANTKARIENFLKDAKLDYHEAYDTHKYDDILVNYYESIDRCAHPCSSKYRDIDYRRVSVNLGLINSVESYRRLVKDSKYIPDKEHQLQILEEIMDLIQELEDYVENYK